MRHLLLTVAPTPARSLTFWGLERSRTWVMAEGWTMGLKAGSSVPEGGCNFTLMACRGQQGAECVCGHAGVCVLGVAAHPGRSPSPAPHLGDGRLEHDVADGLRGSAQHGDHHHQKVSAAGQWVPREVEKDTEAMLVVHGHGQDAACRVRGAAGWRTRGAAGGIPSAELR